MFDHGANETDVREDFVVPLLNSLGYKRGSANNIMREYSIKYSKEQLGREKSSDPLLRGVPDYVLSITGSGRWVLEVKRPNCALDEKVIGQALSYAKHPEVSASYAVVTNGIRLKIFSAHQVATDQPVLECAVVDPEQVAMSTTGYLSPQAIRRNCKLPIIAVGEPLAVGFNNFASIRRGVSLYERNTFQIAPHLPPVVTATLRPELETRMNFLNGHKGNILGGSVRRDSNARIVAKLEFGTDREELAKFAMQKGLLDVEYICLDNHISTDPASPSTFDIVGGYKTEVGEPVYDVIHRQTLEMGFPQSISYTGSAVGSLKDEAFIGTFSMRFDFELTTPLCKVPYSVLSEGSFQVFFE